MLAFTLAVFTALILNDHNRCRYEFTNLFENCYSCFMIKSFRISVQYTGWQLINQPISRFPDKIIILEKQHSNFEGYEKFTHFDLIIYSCCAEGSGNGSAKSGSAS